MFKALVGNIALYGSEVWGWRNEARMDRMKRKYVKWILDLDSNTLNYILDRGSQDERNKIRNSGKSN